MLAQRPYPLLPLWCYERIVETGDLPRASSGSYSSDTWVAPSTTRWVLSDERAASSSCSSSQAGGCSPALTTSSGLSPKFPASRTRAVVWGVARNSSAVVDTCPVEGLDAS